MGVIGKTYRDPNTIILTHVELTHPKLINKMVGIRAVVQWVEHVPHLAYSGLIPVTSYGSQACSYPGQ